MGHDPVPLEVVLEFPTSVAIARAAAQRRGRAELAELLDNAEQAGLTAGLRRLQDEGGYSVPRREVYLPAQLPLHTEIHRDLTSGNASCSHAHVCVLARTSQGDPVHLSAVEQQAAPVAQTTAVRELMRHLEQHGLRSAAAGTAAGRELAHLVEAAAEIPRAMSCPPIRPQARQVHPAARWDPAARAS